MVLFDDIKEVVTEQLNISPEEAFPDKYPKPRRLRPNVDTQNVEELIKTLEEKFKIEIPDDQAEVIITVRDAIKFIEKV